MPNGFNDAYLVPIGNKSYYYQINNNIDNYYLKILDRNNTLYDYYGHSPRNEINNKLIRLRVIMKLIKVPIMNKPLMC